MSSGNGAAVRAYVDADSYSEEIRPIPLARRALALAANGTPAGTLEITAERMRWTPRILGRMAGMDTIDIPKLEVHRVSISESSAIGGTANLRLELTNGANRRFLVRRYQAVMTELVQWPLAPDAVKPLPRRARREQWLLLAIVAAMMITAVIQLLLHG